MSNITDAQIEAINNNAGLNATYLLVDGQPSGQATTDTLTTGVAFQPSTIREAYVYVNVITSAALAINIGPDNTTGITLMASEVAAIGLQSFVLPMGWYMKLTGTMADVAVVSILK